MRTYDEYRQTMRTADPVFDAARDGDMNVLRTLDLSPARLNVTNAKGHSPLMLAAYNGHLDVAKLLIERGADVESPDPGGSTVLMGAAFKGDRAMIQLLVAHGANPRARNHKNQNALDYATMFERTDVIEYLRVLITPEEKR